MVAPSSDASVMGSDDRAAEAERQRGVLAVRDRIARWTQAERRVATAVSGLTLFRQDAVTRSLDLMYEPSMTFVAQGTKRVVLGEETFTYGAGQLLIAAVDLPVQPQIVAASAAQPYLCMTLRLDLRDLAHLMTDGLLPPRRSGPPKRALVVSDASVGLLDAFRRLIDVLAEPADLPMLGPLIQREILYRLLVSEQGERLRDVASAGSHVHRIARAIAHLKADVRASPPIEELAERVGMGASTFYRHFRAVTGVSPLQYQKQLRLIEAQRLMLSKGLDAASAGFRVGYESPSQFSRDYRRQFGDAPSRHVATLSRTA
jgi:AraC-like DNA-binding protein